MGVFWGWSETLIHRGDHRGKKEANVGVRRGFENETKRIRRFLDSLGVP